MVTPTPSSSLGGMHVRAVRAVPHSPVTVHSNVGRYASSSLVLQSGVGDAADARCVPESAFRSTPFQGGSSELASPSQAPIALSARRIQAQGPFLPDGCGDSADATCISGSVLRSSHVLGGSCSLPIPGGSPTPLSAQRVLSPEAAPRRSVENTQVGAIMPKTSLMTSAVLDSRSPSNFATCAPLGIRGSKQQISEASVSTVADAPYTGFASDPTAVAFMQRVEARFADIEQRIEWQGDEYERRFGKHDSAFLEVDDKMRQLIDTGQQFASRLGTTELTGPVPERILAMTPKFGSSNEFVKVDDKSQESGSEMLYSPRSLLMAKYQSTTATDIPTAKDSPRSLLISTGNSNQNMTATDIFGQIRDLQVLLEVVQNEVKIDAQHIKRLHARIDLLECDIISMNDREKVRALTNGSVESQRSSACSILASLPFPDLSANLTKLQDEQKTLNETMWHLREVVGTFDWRIENLASSIPPEDSMNQTRNYRT